MFWIQFLHIWQCMWMQYLVSLNELSLTSYYFHNILDSRIICLSYCFFQDFPAIYITVHSSAIKRGYWILFAEAIDAILIHTADLGRLFSYRRLTSQILFNYLNNLQMKNKCLLLPTKASRTEMILTIKDYWVSSIFLFFSLWFPLFFM